MSCLLNPFISFPAAAPGGTTLNFLTGSYVVNGVTVTAADIVDHPEWIGGSGLELLADGDVAAVIGDLLTLMLTANWTIVLEWSYVHDVGVTASDVYPLVISDGATGTLADNVVKIRRLTSGGYIFIEDYSGGGYRQVYDAFNFADGAHKVALTRTHDKLVFAADGRAMVTGYIDDFVLSPTAATFGGFVGDAIPETLYIRSLTVLAPQDNSLLPGLST